MTEIVIVGLAVVAATKWFRWRRLRAEAIAIAQRLGSLEVQRRTEYDVFCEFLKEVDYSGLEPDVPEELA